MKNTVSRKKPAFVPRSGTSAYAKASADESAGQAGGFGGYSHQASPAKRSFLLRYGPYIIFGLLLVGALNIWYLLYASKIDQLKKDEALNSLLSKYFSMQEKEKKAPKRVPIATPTPSPRAIPHGRTTFGVSSGKKIGPQFADGFLDPYDPQKGTGQTIGIRVTDSAGIAAVTLLLRTDNNVTSYAMTLTSGTPKLGLWTLRREADDTYLYKYDATITARNMHGQQNEVTVTLR